MIRRQAAPKPSLFLPTQQPLVLYESVAEAITVYVSTIILSFAASPLRRGLTDNKGASEPHLPVTVPQFFIRRKCHGATNLSQ